MNQSLWPERWNVLLGQAWIVHMGLPLDLWDGVSPKQPTWPKRFPKKDQGAIPEEGGMDSRWAKATCLCYEKDMGKKEGEFTEETHGKCKYFSHSPHSSLTHSSPEGKKWFSHLVNVNWGTEFAPSSFLDVPAYRKDTFCSALLTLRCEEQG